MTDDDLYDDDESPDDDWGDDDDSPADTIECRHCGADVYEDAEQCPACGEYLIRENSPWQGKSWWWIVLGAIGVIATILSLFAFSGAM